MRKGVGCSKHKHSVRYQQLRGSKSHSPERTWFPPAAVGISWIFQKWPGLSVRASSHLMNQKFNSKDNRLTVIEDVGSPHSSIRRLALAPTASHTAQCHTGLRQAFTTCRPRPLHFKKSLSKGKSSREESEHTKANKIFFRVVLILVPLVGTLW